MTHTAEPSLDVNSAVIGLTSGWEDDLTARSTIMVEMELTSEMTTDSIVMTPFSFPVVPLGQPNIVDLGIGFGHLEGAQLRIAIAIMSILEVLVIVSNIVVITAIRRHHKLRTTTSLYIMSLAISDLCCGLGMPIGLLAKYIPDIFLHSVYVCILPFCLLMTVLASAVLNLLAVSVDRFIALRNPLRYSSIMTRGKSRVLIVLVWLCALCVGLMPLVWHHKDTYTPHSDTGYCQWDRVVTRGYMVLYTVLILAVPMLTIIALYVPIFIIARSHARSIASRARVGNSITPAPSIADVASSTTATSSQYSSRGRKKLSDTGSVASTTSRTRLSKMSLESRVACTIGLIVCTFTVCWMPLTITLLLGVLCPDGCGVSPEVRGWLGLLALVNSFCDPFIYTIRTKDFRVAFRDLLSRFKSWCSTRVCRHETPRRDCENARYSSSYSAAPRGSKSNVSVISNEAVGCQTMSSRRSTMDSLESLSNVMEVSCELEENGNLKELTPL